jgi:hypothetical protein
VDPWVEITYRLIGKKKNASTFHHQPSPLTFLFFFIVIAIFLVSDTDINVYIGRSSV